MKIITWNIKHGGGTRINQVIDTLGEYDADILVITEYRNNEKGKNLRNFLMERGYLFQVAPIIEKNKNTVLVAARDDFSTQLFYRELQDEYFRAVKVENSDLCLYGLYFPQNNEKKKIFNFILDEISKNKEKPAIFIGDFNTGKHFIDEAKSTFYCSQYMDAIEQKSYIDAWRVINKDKKEFTWYSNVGNGFRIDHAFVNEKYKSKVLDCFYSHREREEKISDHSPMVLKLDI